MTNNENLVVLQNNVEELKQKLHEAEVFLYNARALPENNRYSTLKSAETAIKSKLMGEAQEDCEGSYNCGNDQYEQLFYVNEDLYKGVLDVEYNRHDKEYYYIDGTDFQSYLVQRN